MDGNFLVLIVVAMAWRGTHSVMCYWCSGVGSDRECEVRPYAVRTGPVYLNCRANFCLSAKVIDAETGEVKSFARLCDNVPRGNLCIRDSKLLTCYESCTSDLCNNGNPSPVNLPTVNYAGEEFSPRNNGLVHIRTQNRPLDESLLADSVLGTRTNIKPGPQRDLWLASSNERRRSKNIRAHNFPFVIMSSTNQDGQHQKQVIGNPVAVKLDRTKQSTRRDALVAKRKHSNTPQSNIVQRQRVVESSKTIAGVSSLPAAAKIKKKRIAASSGNRDVLTTRSEKKVHSIYKDGGKRHPKMTNAHQSFEFMEADVSFNEFEEGPETRRDNAVTMWPWNSHREELEREDVKREEVVSVSLPIVEDEDGEEDLIQNFRANTTKSSAGVIRESVMTYQKEAGVFAISGSTAVINTDRHTNSSHAKKTPGVPMENTMEKSNLVQEKMTTIKPQKKSEFPVSNVFLRVASSTRGRRTLTSISSKSEKNTAPFRPTQPSSKQTTLPYIWTDKSSWNDDGIISEHLDKKKEHGNKRRKEILATRGKHHRKVHLKGRLELQILSHKSNNTVGSSRPNERFAKTAPNDKVAIYLKESFSGNLRGERRHLHNTKKAELTGSRATGTSSGKLMLLISLLLLYLPCS